MSAEIKSIQLQTLDVNDLYYKETCFGIFGDHRKDIIKMSEYIFSSIKNDINNVFYISDSSKTGDSQFDKLSWYDLSDIDDNINMMIETSSISNRSLVIIDLWNDESYRLINKNEKFRNLFFNSRHYGINIIFQSNYNVCTLAPEYRYIFDYACLLNTKSGNNLKKYYSRYYNIFPNFSSFELLFYKYVKSTDKAIKGLVIINRGYYNNIIDRIGVLKIKDTIKQKYTKINENDEYDYTNLLNKATVINGRRGTGKSTLIRYICSVLEKHIDELYYVGIDFQDHYNECYDIDDIEQLFNEIKNNGKKKLLILSDSIIAKNISILSDLFLNHRFYNITLIVETQIYSLSGYCSRYIDNYFCFVEHIKSNIKLMNNRLFLHSFDDFEHNVTNLKEYEFIHICRNILTYKIESIYKSKINYDDVKDYKPKLSLTNNKVKQFQYNNIIVDDIIENMINDDSISINIIENNSNKQKREIDIEYLNNIISDLIQIDTDNKNKEEELAELKSEFETLKKMFEKFSEKLMKY